MITNIVVANDPVYLLSIYDKSDKGAAVLPIRLFSCVFGLDSPCFLVFPFHWPKAGARVCFVTQENNQQDSIATPLHLGLPSRFLAKELAPLRYHESLAPAYLPNY